MVVVREKEGFGKSVLDMNARYGGPRAGPMPLLHRRYVQIRAPNIYNQPAIQLSIQLSTKVAR